MSGKLERGYTRVARNSQYFCFRNGHIKGEKIPNIAPKIGMLHFSVCLHMVYDEPVLIVA